MIKCNVTIVGRVFRAPEIKNDREGNPFVTFGVSSELKDNGETRDIDISVASDGEDDVILGLSVGDRVKVKGVLTFRKREDVVFFNLSASEVDKTKEKDRIEGTMTFRGTLGGKEILEKQGKKGAYRVFDAYSAEKVAEDKFSYIWVHFVDFSEERPECLVPKSGINAEGALEMNLFNDRLDIGCRVSSLSGWEKQSNNQ
ncbi:MAG: single-stranded DNA-binding protein [Bacteroidales bacterium]|nr:single-stranded DNA-binding protein [Bacteroidales bacterium]